MASHVGLVHVPDRPCRDDPDLWYAKGPLRIAKAKAICATCPYRVRCLWTAMALGETDGIWGGLDPAERAALLAKRDDHGPGVVDLVLVSTPLPVITKAAAS